jgi:DME family drug/metabolite transporter
VRAEPTPLAGSLLIVAAAVTWGTTGATMKLVAAAGAPMSPLAVGFLRVAIAAPCLCLAAALAGGGRVALGRPDWWRGAGAGLAMGAFQVGYFLGVAKTSVAVGSLIAICSAPLLVTGLAALFLGERIDGRTWGALLTGLAGAGLLTIGPHGLGGLRSGFVAGVALALGAGLSYAVYAVVVKDLAGRVPPLTVAALTFSVAAVALAPVGLAERLSAPPVAWALLVYLGVVPTALAYVLYVRALRTTPVTVAAVLTLVEPLTAALLGVLGFGERLGAPGAAGAVLLLVAVAGLTTRRLPAGGAPPAPSAAAGGTVPP